MNVKNSKAISISFRVDEGVVEHNNRDFIAKNVDKERIGNNITYRRQDIREKYNEIFSKLSTNTIQGRKETTER